MSDIYRKPSWKTSREKERVRVPVVSQPPAFFLPVISPSIYFKNVDTQFL